MHVVGVRILGVLYITLQSHLQASASINRSLYVASVEVAGLEGHFVLSTKR